MSSPVSESTSKASALVPIGVVGRPRGLEGQMRVRLFDPDSRALYHVAEVVLESEDGARREVRAIRRAETIGKDLVLTLEGASSRDAAESLRKHTVLVERSALPKPDPGEVYDVDLVGMTVVNSELQRIGIVDGVEHPPANDVLIVKLTETGRWIDVPMIASVVAAIDLESRRVVVELPNGLPDRAKR